MRLEIKLAIGFLLTLSIFVALSVYTYLTSKEQIESSRWVTHTNEVLYSSQRLLTAVLDAETGYRGFVLTGNPKFLEPYLNSTDSIKGRLTELLKLSADNSLQQAKLKKLAVVINEKIKWGEQVIAARQISFEDARNLVTSLKGKKLMGEIREMVRDFQTEEKRLLVSRTAESETQIYNFSNVTLITRILIVIILLTMYWMVFVNLNARRQAEADLRNMSAEIRDLYDNAPCGYHSVNVHGLVVEMNETELQWLGYPREEVINKLTLNDLITEATYHVLEENFLLLKKRGFVNNVALDFKRKDGSSFPSIVSSTAIVGPAGNFLRSRSTVFDNTERKEAEEKIKESELMFSTLFYKSPVMKAIMEASTGKYIEVNDTLADFLGHTKEEILGKTSIELNMHSHPGKREQIIKNILKDGFVRELEMQLNSKDGKARWVSTNVDIVNLNGKDCFLSAGIDITSRKEAEEKISQMNSELVQRTAQLETVNKELEAFTYSVSHDLRAPLRSVVGYTQILREDYGNKLDKEGKRVTQVIINNANRMGQLIDDLLDFSRLGRKELRKANLNMDEMVQGILRELMTSQNGRQPEVKVIPLKRSRADIGMLHQVWTNLISNALKYSQKKETIKIEIGSFDENGHICYYISDNGAGFDMKYVDKLFGVFQRLHKINDFEGTGVGLALVKRIIQRHGGTVRAEGKINEGAKFYFTLPRN